MVNKQKWYTRKWFKTILCVTLAIGMLVGLIVIIGTTKVTQTILVTGFEPFGDKDTNITQQVMAGIPDEINGHVIKKVILPVSYSQSKEALEEAVKEYQPNMILSLGESGSIPNKKYLKYEHIAKNKVTSASKDNDGVSKKDELLIEDGENMYYSQLDYTQFPRTTKVYDSLDAGGYVCNAVMYYGTKIGEESKGDIKAGFIHVKAGLNDKEVKESAKIIETYIGNQNKEAVYFYEWLLGTIADNK